MEMTMIFILKNRRKKANIIILGHSFIIIVCEFGIKYTHF